MRILLSELSLTDLDVTTTRKVSGRQLMEEGLSVELKTQPGSAVII